MASSERRLSSYLTKATEDMQRSRRIVSTASLRNTPGRPEEPHAHIEPPGMGVSDIRKALRSATAAAHHVLDHHPLMQRLIGNDLTLESYAASLAAMYQPHVRREQDPKPLRMQLAIPVALQCGVRCRRFRWQNAF